MKVLIQNRPDAFEVFGGDTVQMMKTAQYLRKRGVHVDVSLELTPKLQEYDVIHLMNITRVTFTYVQLMNARRQKKKVVLSPIYWNTKELVYAYLQGLFFNLNHPSSLKELGKACFSSLTNKTFLNEVKELMYNKELASTVLSRVDCLLPNSRAELETLKSDFSGIFKNQRKDVVIVPNGVDADFFGDVSPKKFSEKYGFSDFILNVGHFSYRKNQLSLIKALKGLGIDVVFVGESPSSSTYYGIKNAIDMLYYQKCRREADWSFRFLRAMPHSELAGVYAACKVFVLPSLYETPGLAALEAAISGANICITHGGSTREYFSALASYCDPYNVDSIRDAVLQAYQAPKSTLLKNHVLTNFTWNKTAEATLKAYKEVLDK